MRRLSVLAVIMLGLSGLGGTYPTSSGSAILGGGGAIAIPYCFSSVQTALIVSTAGSEDRGSPLVEKTSVASEWVPTATADTALMFASFPSGTWTIDKFYATATATIVAAGEDCLVTLEYAAPGGASTSVAAIALGDGTTLGDDLGTTCEFSALGADASTVDDVGDYCVQTFTAVTVPALSGWRVRINDEDVGGANTCTLLTSATICVVGTQN